MEKWHYIEEDGVSAEWGLAVDDMLSWAINKEHSPPVLHLYTFVPSVIIGRYQNLEDSIDTERCRERGFEYNRRITGGGTVMMGPDVLALGFAAPMDHPAIPRTVAHVFSTMSEVFRLALDTLGIAAGFRPKNDLTIRNRKVAGLAATNEGDDVLFFHTSMCVGFDIERMLELLKLPVEKLQDRGISCFSERMITIREALGNNISLETVRQTVKEAFEKYFDIEFVPHRLSSGEEGRVRFLIREKYRKNEWLNAIRALRRRKGRAVRKTGGGVLIADTAFKGKIIENVLLTGDFFARKDDIARIEATLKWTSAYREDILKNLKTVMDRNTIYNVTPEILASVIHESTQQGKE
jgi:lipoate-protein ligase A